MIVRTRNSAYEVSVAARKFRQLSDGDRLEQLAVGEWQAYDMLGPIQPGEPMRLFRHKEDAGRASRFGVWSTSPVIEVVA
jgi:hypothetical protein